MANNFNKNKKVMSDIVVKRQVEQIPKIQSVKTRIKPSLSKENEINKAEPQDFFKKINTVRPSIIQEVAEERRTFGWGKRVLLVVFILAVLYGVYGFSTARMEVTIIPQSMDINLNNDFSLSTQASSVGQVVPYRTVSVADIEQGNFDAETTSSGGSKAHGTVAIFNKTSVPQILIATTRLQTPDGKIFRIPKNVTVPVGSIDVEVFADQTGPDYNIGLSDFTLPGFKGSPKFDKIFGRSKTEMDGGASGSQKVVGQNEVNAALAALTQKAKDQMKAILTSKLQPDELLLPSTLEYVVTSQDISPVIGSAADSFTIVLKGEIHGATVSRKDLSKAVAGDKLPQPADLSNAENLVLGLTGYFYQGTAATLHVSGSAHIVSDVLNNDVRAAISDKKISDAKGILGLFPQLTEVKVRYYPFWLKNVPSNQDRIIVTQQ